MSKYILVINNDEAEGNGDVMSLSEVTDEVGELLRSGYYEVQKLAPYPDGGLVLI